MQPRTTFTPSPGPTRTREQVVDALARAGSVKEAAELLGVSRTTLYDYLRRYDIKVRRGVLTTS